MLGEAAVTSGLQSNCTGYVTACAVLLHHSTANPGRPGHLPSAVLRLQASPLMISLLLSLAAKQQQQQMLMQSCKPS